MGVVRWYVSRGRIGRRTWWLHYAVPLFVLGVLASVADLAFGLTEIERTTSGTSYTVSWQMGPIALVVTALLLAPAISSTVTRLQDQEKPAVWLLWLLFPVVGWLVLFVLLGFIAGNPGANRFGPPPPGSRPPYADPAYPLTYR
jgi:uncharacterized membrane protein YhaH (DUF805 family)